MSPSAGLRSCLVLLLLLAGFVGPAAANVLGIERYLGFRDLSYSGDMVVTLRGETLRGKVVRMGAAQRTEMTLRGKALVAIADVANSHGIVMLTKDTTYAVVDLLNFSVDKWVPQPQNHRNVVLTPIEGEGGRETVNGQSARRYELSGLFPQGTPYSASLWVTDAGVIVRLIAEIGGEPMPVTYNLLNLRLGPQDPLLFQVPPTYLKLPWSEVERILTE